MIAVTRIVISYGRAQQSNGVPRLTFPSPKNFMGLSQKAELRCNSRTSFANHHALQPCWRHWRQQRRSPFPSLAGTHRPVRIGAAVRTESERRLPLKPCINTRRPAASYRAATVASPAILAERAQAQVRWPACFQTLPGNQTDRLELQQYYLMARG